MTRKTIGYLAGLAFASYALCAYGQMRITELKLPAYSMHVFEIPDGEPPLFIPQKPLDLVIKQYKLCDGMGYICAFATGPPGQIVIDAYRNGEPGQMPVFVRLIATVGVGPVDPVDPVDPDPPPLGAWAKLALSAVETIPEQSRVLIPTIAANFQATASAIAAGVIKTKPAAIQDLHERNQRAWGANGEADWRDWLYRVGREIDRVEDAGKLESVITYGQVLRELGKGLAAHGS